MTKTKTVRELADIISMITRVDLTAKEIYDNLLILANQYELTKFILRNYVTDEVHRHFKQKVQAAVLTKKDSRFSWLDITTFTFFPIYFLLLSFTTDLFFSSEKLRWFILALLVLGYGIMQYQKHYQRDKQINLLNLNLLLEFLDIHS